MPVEGMPYLKQIATMQQHSKRYGIPMATFLTTPNFTKKIYGISL
jgi:hypothetical protein